MSRLIGLLILVSVVIAILVSAMFDLKVITSPLNDEIRFSSEVLPEGYTLVAAGETFLFVEDEDGRLLTWKSGSLTPVQIPVGYEFLTASDSSLILKNDGGDLFRYKYRH